MVGSCVLHLTRLAENQTALKGRADGPQGLGAGWHRLGWGVGKGSFCCSGLTINSILWQTGLPPSKGDRKERTDPGPRMQRTTQGSTSMEISPDEHDGSSHLQ